MGSVTTSFILLPLVCALAEPPSPFHPGVGAEVAGLASTSPNLDPDPRPVENTERGSTRTQPPPPRYALGSSSRPPSYYERVQQSREAQIAQVSAAVAAQAAMIIYGVLRMVGEAKNRKDDPREKPYPYRR